MNKARDKLVDEIFGEALALAPDARQEFLAERCAGDVPLLQQVDALLLASESSDSLLDDSISGLRDRVFRSMLSGDAKLAEDLSGQRVGNWMLQQRIARGGLATVYKAARADGAFDQTVAFKVLRRGLDTDDLISRFRAERQILSSLEHPSIARLLDGGALNDGRPYLVLEYVDGAPITAHCASNTVDMRGRVVLMVAVLRALHYAHVHLVVHRDVKPSNILVSREGKIVLLDFGIAKLLDPQSMPGAATATRTGVALLTPGYGSPEQHAGGPVTTASDIYQAGLVLYELLTGARPRRDRSGDARNEPPLPSRMLGDPARAREVRGDLDAIVRKAMHVDPAQRYSSADEMAADLESYLNGLPVIARPDTARYRLAKLTQRRPWLVPAIAVLVLAVTAYVATLTVYSQRLSHEERLATASQQFLVDLFRSPDPFAPANTEIGSGISVVEALEIGQQRVRSELADQPELQAMLLRTISDVYQSLDVAPDAIELRAEALALERTLYGERSPQVVASLRALGEMHNGSGDLSKAADLLDQQMAIARIIFKGDSPELGLSEIAVGMHAHRAGDLERGRALLLSGVQKLRPERTRYARKIIGALLATAEHHGIESQEASLAAIREAEVIANDAFGEASLQSALVRVRLASTMSMFGDHDAAESIFLAAIPALDRQLGKSHGSSLNALNNLGYLYSRSGEDAKSEQIHRELLDRHLQKYGSAHRSVADSYQNLASAIARQDRFDEALPLHRKAHDTYTRVLNSDHYIVGFPLVSIAFAELQLGHAPKAESAARAALAHFEAAVPGSFLEGVARCLVGLSLEQSGRLGEGGAMVEASHALMQAGSIPAPYPSLCRVPGR